MNKSEPKPKLILPIIKKEVPKFSLKWIFGENIIIKWLGIKIFNKKLKK